MTRKAIIVFLMSALLVTLVYQVPAIAHGGDDEQEVRIRIRNRQAVQVFPVFVQPAVVISQGIVLVIRLDGLNTILILNNGGFAQPVLITPATVIFGQTVLTSTVRTRDVVVVHGVRNRNGTIVASRIKIVSRVRRG